MSECDGQARRVVHISLRHGAVLLVQHRIAVQKESSTLPEYYVVRGIPHIVVIDQEGKVRLVKVGAQEESAKDIEGMIEKLLAKGSAEKP